MLHAVLASAALATAPNPSPAAILEPADTQIAIDALAIAHCTRVPTPAGPVPPRELTRLRQALDQRVAWGQLVSRPLLRTKVGTPAQITTGQRLPGGENQVQFALSADPQPSEDRGIQLAVTVTVLDASAEVSYPVDSGLGWLLRVDAAPDLRCRGRRHAETLVLVMPHVLDADHPIEAVRAHARPAPAEDTEDDLLQAFLNDMPGWM